MSCNIRERGFILFDKIPVPTIELSWRQFQTFLDIYLPEKLIWKLHCPQSKTFIRGAIPGVSDELWEENAIGGKRWDVATQERKVCNMEIEIVTFVVKGSKIEKVPRGIRGEKSSKDMASSRNLVSTIEALASPKMGDGTRCPEG